MGDLMWFCGVFEEWIWWRLVLKFFGDSKQSLEFVKMNEVAKTLFNEVKFVNLTYYTWIKKMGFRMFEVDWNWREYVFHCTREHIKQMVQRVLYDKDFINWNVSDKKKC